MRMIMWFSGVFRMFVIVLAVITGMIMSVRFLIMVMCVRMGMFVGVTMFVVMGMNVAVSSAIMFMNMLMRVFMRMRMIVLMGVVAFHDWDLLSRYLMSLQTGKIAFQPNQHC